MILVISSYLDSRYYDWLCIVGYLNCVGCSIVWVIVLCEVMIMIMILILMLRVDVTDISGANIVVTINIIIHVSVLC